MRMTCPVTGYEDCYVDFDERWSRAEIRQFGSKGGNTVELLRSKVNSVSVRLLDGAIDQPDQITEEALDKMQWEVFQWFVVLPQLVVRQVLDLGEATRRQLWHTPETSPDTEESAST